MKNMWWATCFVILAPIFAFVFDDQANLSTESDTVNGTIDQENGFQQRSRPLFQERCEQYRGSVCVDHMNSQSLVFMRSGENQDEIESRLAKNMKHVAKLMSPECYPDALRVACITLFPPCRHVNQTTAAPLKMCKESCLGLPKSYCSKGFGLLPHLKIIQAIDDCDSLPEVDSNQPCARISLPGNNYKNLQCKRSFRRKSLRTASLENRLEPITGRGSICQNVRWKPLSKGAKHLINRILPGADNIPNGQYAKSATNVYCFRVPFKLSTLLQSKKEYSKVIPLPELKQVPYDSVVYGFSVKLNRESKMKHLLFPIGHMKEYSIDKMVTVPNVTAYFYKDASVSKVFGEGMFNLCGTEFQIRIEQTKPDETLLTGRSPHPVDLSTVELAFGLRQPTADLRHIMDSFRILNLRLTNPKLSIIWEDTDRRTMRFSGQAYNSGWGNVEVNVELLLGTDQSFWATAITTTRQSFKEIFGIFADWKHVRLAKLLDMALDVNKVGFVLATRDVKIPKHPSLSFQHEPVKTMARNEIPNGLMLEAHANVKDSCKRNDNRSFICQLIQFAVGIKATTNVRIKSDLKGLLLVLEFHPDGLVPRYSASALAKLRKTWEKINPFARIPSNNVEITENMDQSWRFLPRYDGIIWLRKLEIHVKFLESMDLFDSKIVHLSGDVVILNKRYTYKINNVGLSYCLRLLDSITEILKHCSKRSH